MNQNRGEWSELYTLFYCLSKGKIEVTDYTLNEVIDNYKILEVHRKKLSDSKIETSFIILENSKIIHQNVEYEGKIFEDKANEVLEFILAAPVGNGSFSISSIEKFCTEIDVILKSPSQEKSDFDASIEDKRLNTKKRLGYTLKSQLGSPSTLLNASSATNFKYVIRGFNDKSQLINEINAINTRTKLQDRFKKIKEFGCNIEFKEVNNPIFKANLQYVDGDLEKILGYILLYSYEFENKDFGFLIRKISEINPLNISNFQGNEYISRVYYKKVSSLLEAIAFGMKPATSYNPDIINKMGGIIIVKDSGEIKLLDKVYNEEHLFKYLFENLKLESPSARRYHMLELEEVANEVVFTLNLQIRFIR